MADSVFQHGLKPDFSVDLYGLDYISFIEQWEEIGTYLRCVSQVINHYHFSAISSLCKPFST